MEFSNMFKHKYSIMRTTDMKWLYIENNEVKWEHSSYKYTTLNNVLINELTTHIKSKVFRDANNLSALLKYNADTDTITITNNPQEAVYTVVKRDNDNRIFYCSETYMIIYHPKS